MEEKVPLHAQKVAILSRLMKENSSLTLEESLLLLKDETEEDNNVVKSEESIVDFGRATWYNTHMYPRTSTNTDPFFYGTITTTSTTSSNTLNNSEAISEINTDTEHANL